MYGTSVPKKLHLARNLSLPLDAVTQTFAFMGRRGGGKTYAAGKLVEEMLDAGAQVVILDPVGTWYGLRTRGTGPGYSIPVVGGAHGDIPLEPIGGVIVADFVVDTGTSLVVDVSHFRKNQRRQFVTDFAEQLFHRKKRSASPLHIVIEESQFFVPQQMRGGDERLLGAVSDLTLLGRNYGIGVSLLSQRPQKVHKDVLNQTECLFAFQMTGPHERKAIDAWIAEKGVLDGDAALLAKLPQGTAIVWSPQWLEVYQRVKINQKKTADTSATPTVGRKVKTRRLAPVDLDAISDAMAATIEAAKQKDPKHLRQQLVERDRRIVQLEAELKNQPKQVEVVPAVRPADLAKLNTLLKRYEAATSKAAERWEGLHGDMLAAVSVLSKAVKSAAPMATRPAKPVPAPVTSRAALPVPKVRHTPSNGDAKIGRGPLRILGAIVSLHPRSLTRAQVSTLSGFSLRSSTFANYLSVLRTGGYIEGGPEYRATDLGRALIDVVPVAPTTEELYQLWAPRLPGSSKRMLRLFIEHYPNGLERDQLAELAGHSTRSSTFANYLSKLRTNKLIEKRNGLYYASDTLFPTRT
jgi:hypothetical protein